jgi:pimeloyl-ACP methyl ester carboxylesterase
MTVKISWERRGGGPPLLLIQGIGLARWGWGHALDLLAERFDVLAYDNRGIGESDAPAGPYSISMLADDALMVLDEAGVSKSHVLGASLGGMVAQHLAVEHPERVDHLVLVCTTPGRNEAFPVPEPTVRLFAETAGLDRETAITMFTPNALSAAANDELVRRIVALRLEKPQDAGAWGAQVAAGAGFEGVDLSRIEAPTLVLHGSADNVVDIRNAALLAEGIRDARSQVLQGGHMFWWEIPDEFAAVVGDFLS